MKSERETDLSLIRCAAIVGDRRLFDRVTAIIFSFSQQPNPVHAHNSSSTTPCVHTTRCVFRDSRPPTFFFFPSLNYLFFFFLLLSWSVSDDCCLRGSVGFFCSFTCLILLYLFFFWFRPLLALSLVGNYRVENCVLMTGSCVCVFSTKKVGCERVKVLWKCDDPMALWAASLHLVIRQRAAVAPATHG